jgi:hypothetical protein
LENVDIFYGHLEYFTNFGEYFLTTWYILCSVDTFFRFGYHVPKKKSGNPADGQLRRWGKKSLIHAEASLISLNCVESNALAC